MEIYKYKCHECNHVGYKTTWPLECKNCGAELKGIAIDFIDTEDD
jgi:Zn finger protein HypA/HybF involved in hydrogenase expression